MASDLQRLGVNALDDLKDRDAREMYEALCQLDGARHDPCVLDVFTAVVEYARGGPPTPWWVYSRRRKARDR